jgi:hypothetical protein
MEYSKFNETQRPPPSNYEARAKRKQPSCQATRVMNATLTLLARHEIRLRFSERLKSTE